MGLGRVRRTDASPQITINGSGFSAANNSVFVGGSSATPISQGVSQITVDLPLPFSSSIFALRSIHVPVVVVNDDTGEVSDEAWIWIKGDLDEVADEVVDTAIPGPFEATGIPQVADRFEARDMQRLATLIEALLFDVSDGNVLAWDGSKLAEPAGLKGSGAGQVLEVDLGESTGLLWHFRLDAWLRFGGVVSTGQTANLNAAGVQFATIGGGVDDNWALDDGTLDLVSIVGRSSGGGTISLVRVLVNGGEAFNSGALATISYHNAISVAVSEGDVIEVEVTGAGPGGSAVALVGGVRLLVD